jgi:hypothetical protein
MSSFDQVRIASLPVDPLRLAKSFALKATSVGLAILLACWGISLLLHRQAQPALLAATQPASTEAPKTNSANQTTLQEKSNSPPLAEPQASERKEALVVKRTVTEFQTVDHAEGEVITGWEFEDNRRGLKPLRQYCYYIAPIPDANYKSNKIDIALDGHTLVDVDSASVPGLQEALGKCRWWTAERNQI